MNKAIFLVGGPGSGKDVILRNILSQHNLLEFTLEQVNSTFINKISEKDKRFSILNKESFVISTNAYSYENIKHTKNLLENFGYETSMIFIDVSDEVSKSRLANREHFSEENRREKFSKAKENMNKFYDLFEDFAMYENNLSIEDCENIDGLYLFCEVFINSKEGAVLFEQEDLNERLLDRFSIKKKLKNKTENDDYPPDVLTKVKTDRIGDEYSIRNSGMGFPTTVGAIYSESFTDAAADMPAFTSFERGVPPMETLPDTKEVRKFENKKPIVQKIKKIAILSWKGKNES
jgi:shikimate kinase